MPLSVVSVGTMKMSVQEELPIAIDMTKLLLSVSGATISSPTSRLIEVSQGIVITLGVSPTVNGNIITQVVNGSLLTAGLHYNLFLGFTGVAGVFIPVASVLIITGI